MPRHRFRRHHLRCQSVGNTMSRTSKANTPGRTIFDAGEEDLALAIAGDVAAIETAARRYDETRDIVDASTLLDSIEHLRRFVLLRQTLAKGLAKPARPGGAPRGKQICEILHGLIGDVPSLVKACTQNGNYRMERDTRRAIACLCFLGSLDPQFI